jgi:hypothetical protein
MSGRDLQSKQKVAVRSLERAMTKAAEMVRDQPTEYRPKAFVVFAVQVLDWADATEEADRLNFLLAPALDIDLSILKAVENWDEAPDEVFEFLASLPVDRVMAYHEPEMDCLVVRIGESPEEKSLFASRGDWIAVLPEIGLAVFPDSAFRTMFAAKRKPQR